MTIVSKKKAPPARIELDLTGPQGNALVLLGYANLFANQLGLDKQKIHQEMTAGDYENLVKVFDTYFGELVTMYR